jgi:hypothetical protein
MQADFVLFLRANLATRGSWWPVTLLYADRQSGPFEVFARSRSTAYFNKAKALLGIQSKNELQRLMEVFDSDRNSVPRWEHNSISPQALSGFTQLATTP